MMIANCIHNSIRQPPDPHWNMNKKIILVLCIIESLSLLYLLFISWIICSRIWCMDKFNGSFMQTKHLCVWIHIWGKGCSCRETCLSPPVKYFYRPFEGGTSFVDHLCYLCLVIGMLSRLFIAALWSPEGKGLTSWLLFVMFIVILLFSHLVSWDRCGTWLYWFLILSVFLTFTYSQEKKSEKLTSTGILWRKGFDTYLRGNLVCWIQKPVLASWEMAS